MAYGKSANVALANNVVIEKRSRRMALHSIIHCKIAYPRCCVGNLVLQHVWLTVWASMGNSYVHSSIFAYWIIKYIVDNLLAYHVLAIMLWTWRNSVKRLACVKLTVVRCAFVGRWSIEARWRQAFVLVYNSLDAGIVTNLLSCIEQTLSDSEYVSFCCILFKRDIFPSSSLQLLGNT